MAAGKVIRKKLSTAVTLHPGIREWAEQLMEWGRYASTTELVTNLIRMEYERKTAAAAAGPPLGPVKPLSEADQAALTELVEGNSKVKSQKEKPIG